MSPNKQVLNISATLTDIIDIELGHRKSRAERQSVDGVGNPIPWMTYSAIFYLEQFDMRDKEVFEWGGGNSSLFLSERVKNVTTIELKKEWYDYVLANKKDNMKIRHASVENYASIINDEEKLYDIIIVDGEIDRRFECAEYAIKYVKDDGMIILDNSDWLTNTCELLRNSGLIQIDMAGFGPINNYTWCTSFFITRKFNFKNRNKKQPNFVVGGLDNIRD